MKITAFLISLVGKCTEDRKIYQNCTHRSVRTRLNSANICYHKTDNLLSSHILVNRKIQIYETVIVYFLCMGMKLLYYNMVWETVYEGV